MNRDADSALLLDAVFIDQAASWFVRHSSGLMSTQEHATFERWRQADPRHALAWSRFEILQQTFQSASAMAPANVANSTLRTTRRRVGERRQMLKGLLALGAVIPMAQWLRQSNAVHQALADYHTAVGERRQFTLADGTQLWLNTDSAVDVRFNIGERRLLLRNGEVQIATAHDAAARPFVVTTVDGSLRPLGTRFTVRRYGDETQTLLRVSEGIVEARPRSGNNAQRVAAGQALHFDDSHISALMPATIASDAWVDGMLGAERTRLADFLAELSRHRRGVLRCDPLVADLRLTGTFPLRSTSSQTDTDRVLAKLAETLPVKLQYRSRYWVTVIPR